MTGAEFSSKYKLLRRITNDGVSSYHAQHSGTNQAAMVHIHPGVSVADLRQKLDELDRNDRDKVLEVVEVDGSAVAVTQFIQGFRSFEAWITERLAPTPPFGVAATASPTPAPPIPLGEMQKDAPGEFTQMFQAASAGAPAAPAPIIPAAPVPPTAPVAPAAAPTARAQQAPPPMRPASSPAPPSEASGESFTQLFGGAPAAPSPSYPAPGPVNPPPPPSPPRQVAPPPPPPPPPLMRNPVLPPAQASPAARSEPGSFTEMFLQPSPGAAPPPPQAYPATPVPGGAFGGGGSSDSPWARAGGLPPALQPSPSASVPPPLAAHGGARGSFTELLNSVNPGPAAPPPGIAAPLPPAPRAPTGPMAHQPSDFTRIVNATPSSSRPIDGPAAAAAPRGVQPARAQAQPGAAPARAADAAAAEKKMKSFVIMMSLVNVLFTLVVALVLFFVLRG